MKDFKSAGKTLFCEPNNIEKKPIQSSFITEQKDEKESPLEEKSEDNKTE